MPRNAAVTKTLDGFRNCCRMRGPLDGTAERPERKAARVNGKMVHRVLTASEVAVRCAARLDASVKRVDRERERR